MTINDKPIFIEFADSLINVVEVVSMIEYKATDKHPQHIEIQFKNNTSMKITNTTVAELKLHIDEILVNKDDN